MRVGRNSEIGPVNGVKYIKVDPWCEEFCEVVPTCSSYDNECDMIASGAFPDEIPSLCGGGGGSEF